MNSASVLPDINIPHAVDTSSDAPPPAARYRMAPLIVFFVTVFASMAAAATVVTEAPLMLVGLY